MQRPTHKIRSRTSSKRSRREPREVPRARRRLRDRLAIVSVAIGLGVSTAWAAPISGSGATACPDMPTLNPNPPSPLGATDIIHFEAGSLIIPMDHCYQRSDFPSNTLVEMAINETYGGNPSWDDANVDCEGNSDGDFGQMQAHHVIQRLIEGGVPVHWSILSGKTAWASADFSIVGSEPVSLMSWNGTETSRYSGLSKISYAGAPYVIDEADVADAKLIINGLGSSFDDVAYHVAETSFDAPIYKTMGAMPTLAIVDLRSSSNASNYFTRQKTSELSSAISSIGMDATQSWWRWATADVVGGGALVSGGAPVVDMVWVPSFGFPNSGVAGLSTAETNLLRALESFADAGGTLVFQSESIAALEGYGTFNTSGAGSYTADEPPAMSDAFVHSDGGIHAELLAAAYGGNSTTELVAAEDYSDPASQWGGSAWVGIGGGKYDWTARCDRGYRDGVRRMVFGAEVGGSPTDDSDYATWKHYDNDSTKGRIYYLGAYNLDSNRQPLFRMQMNTILVETDDYVATAEGEVGRSAPIVAAVTEIDGNEELQYTGTYNAVFPPVPASQYTTAATSNDFEFPDVTGNLRGIRTSLLGASTDLDDPLFDPTDALYGVYLDGGSILASQGSGAFGSCSGCRTIFTNDGINKIPLTTTTADLDNFKDEFGLASGVDADAERLVELIHTGIIDGATRVAGLGGIDRSTLALIEKSPTIGTDRPVMAYVGGLDGMMHAFCANEVGVCAASTGMGVGAELWAFLPRNELPKVASNTTRIDGSPKVSDVFGYFGGSTTKTYKTVLTFQTGNDDPAGVYALDVTDPGSPEILWEYTTPGAGTNIAMAVIYLPGEGLVNATFMQVASGTAIPGMHVGAVNSASGDLIWTQSYDYPSARSGGTDVPASGIPGGVSVFASDGGDVADTVLVPSLWGAVWALDATTGDNQNGSDPLFKFDSDFHPIGAPVSVYRDFQDQQLRAVVVSGGFTDSLSPTSTLWAPDSIEQYAISFPIDTSLAPILDTDVCSDPTLGVCVNFGAGNRAFSQATIIGGEIFFTTDSQDVNASIFGSSGSTGRLYQVTINGGASSFTTIPSGAAAVDVSATSNAVFTGGGSAVQKTDITGYDTNGGSVEVAAAGSAKRFLWLRSQ